MGNGMPPKSPFAGMSFNKPGQLANPIGVDPAKGLSAATPSNTAGGWIGLGSSAVSALGSAMPSPYDQRIGMEKPSFMKEMMDMTFTGMGASVGGPWGALVGGIIDTGKNIGSYINKKAKYNTATQRWENDEEQDQRLQSMQSDYTGYARYGTKTPYSYANGGGVPVEVERNEVMFMPQQDGSYQMLGATGANAPTHEQGGVKTTLPPGALVFPKQYIPQVMQAYQNQDWGGMDAISQDMLANAEQAAAQGQPYSSGGAPMFNNGGKVAETIRSYDPATDTERKAARQLTNSVLMDESIDQDEKDLLLMGLVAKIKGDDPVVQRMKEMHPEHYNYFVGATDKWEKAPMGVQDMFDPQNPYGYSPDYEGEGNNNTKQMVNALQNRVQYGEKIDAGTDKGKYRGEDGAIVDKNPYKPLPMTTTQGATPQSQVVTPPTSGVLDRTGTRQAAMKAGVYQDASGNPLTYWDEKTGKRVFTSKAKEYGMEGDVNAFVQGGGKASSLMSKTTQPAPKAPATTPKEEAPVAPPSVGGGLKQPGVFYGDAPVNTGSMSFSGKSAQGVPKMYDATPLQPRGMGYLGKDGMDLTLGEKVTGVDVGREVDSVNKPYGTQNNTHIQTLKSHIKDAAESKEPFKVSELEYLISNAKSLGIFEDADVQESLRAMIKRPVTYGYNRLTGKMTTPSGYRYGGKTPYAKGGKKC